MRSRFQSESPREHLVRHVQTLERLTAAVLVSDVSDYHEWNTPSFDDYVATVAKPLGLNLKRLAAVRDKHTPKSDAAETKKAAK